MTSFHERQKSLFKTLENAEEQYSFSKSNKAKEPLEQDFGVIDKHTYRKLKHEMKQFRGRESIFKRPEAALKDCLRSRTIPGHIKNPKNWVYYSLSDVTPDQMTDAANTATALSIIKKMEEQEEEAKRSLGDVSEDDTVFKKPTFQVSSTIKKDNQDEQKAIFKYGKVIMPEYVVGMTKKKEPRKIIHKKQEQTESVKKVDVKLNHLYEDED